MEGEYERRRRTLITILRYHGILTIVLYLLDVTTSILVAVQFARKGRDNGRWLGGMWTWLVVLPLLLTCIVIYWVTSKKNKDKEIKSFSDLLRTVNETLAYRYLRLLACVVCPFLLPVFAWFEGFESTMMTPALECDDTTTPWAPGTFGTGTGKSYFKGSSGRGSVPEHLQGLLDSSLYQRHITSLNCFRVATVCNSAPQILVQLLAIHSGVGAGAGQHQNSSNSSDIHLMNATATSGAAEMTAASYAVSPVQVVSIAVSLVAILAHWVGIPRAPLLKMSLCKCLLVAFDVSAAFFTISTFILPPAVATTSSDSSSSSSAIFSVWREWHYYQVRAFACVASLYCLVWLEKTIAKLKNTFLGELPLFYLDVAGCLYGCVAWLLCIPEQGGGKIVPAIFAVCSACALVLFVCNLGLFAILLCSFYLLAVHVLSSSTFCWLLLLLHALEPADARLADLYHYYTFVTHRDEFKPEQSNNGTCSKKSTLLYADSYAEKIRFTVMYLALRETEKKGTPIQTFCGQIANFRPLLKKGRNLQPHDLCMCWLKDLIRMKYILPCRYRSVAVLAAIFVICFCFILLLNCVANALFPLATIATATKDYFYHLRYGKREVGVNASLNLNPLQTAFAVPLIICCLLLVCLARPLYRYMRFLYHLKGLWAFTETMFELTVTVTGSRFKTQFFASKNDIIMAYYRPKPAVVLAHSCDVSVLPTSTLVHDVAPYLPTEGWMRIVTDDLSREEMNQINAVAAAEAQEEMDEVPLSVSADAGGEYFDDLPPQRSSHLLFGGHHSMIYLDMDARLRQSADRT